MFTPVLSINSTWVIYDCLILRKEAELLLGSPGAVRGCNSVHLHGSPRSDSHNACGPAVDGPHLLPDWTFSWPVSSCSAALCGANRAVCSFLPRGKLPGQK